MLTHRIAMCLAAVLCLGLVPAAARADTLELGEKLGRETRAAKAQAQSMQGRLPSPRLVREVGYVAQLGGRIEQAIRQNNFAAASGELGSLKQRMSVAQDALAEVERNNGGRDMVRSFVRQMRARMRAISATIKELESSL